MVSDEAREHLEREFRRIDRFLDERNRRLSMANEAIALGHVGIAPMSEITDLARRTIRVG